MAFERGQTVEIIDMDKGFTNSFYPAVVISQVTQEKFIIQYSTLYDKQIGDYDEFRPLREFQKEEKIRPTPPEVFVQEFCVNDKVDAYYQDGWWFGRIRRVKAGEIKKYVVHFNGTKENIEFEVGDLRVHQVWSQGQWSTP
ncbi:hypothetical protein LIER_42295 [Lithospermum erythrorhizon]|uniref:Agenet domain-containing protein n=1 Tax=Lithospermum erythrorhizon TaxID=34254 RepID=A0AAV3RMB8_LITER